MNGYTLTVNGDLIQSGGKMYIDNGTLNVNGDYTITNKTHVDSKTGETVEDSNGILQMKNTSDTVNVHGNFYTKSNQTCYDGYAYNCFTNGTLAIDGNFYQYNNGTATNFVSSGTIVKFVGKGTHDIYFENVLSYIEGQYLDVPDGAKIKFTGIFRGFTLSQDIVLDGDTTYDCETMNLNGHTLTVDGDLIQRGGRMYIDNGTLNVNGNYTITNKTHVDSETGRTVEDSNGILKMENTSDTVNVHGNFYTKSNQTCYDGYAYNCFTNGTLAIDGNFYQYNNGTATNFCSSGTIVKFVGKGTHDIYFESEESYMHTLEVTDNAKIKFTGVFHGFTLSQDIVIDGDTTYNCGTMYLNGHTLTIDGNLIQSGGVMDLNAGILNVNNSCTQDGGKMYIDNGTLNVNGNYTITNKTHVDSETGATVEDSNGILKMENTSDTVNVHGDFCTKSNQTCYDGFAYNCFTKGTLAIDGNFYQYNNGTATNFVSSGTIVKFVGKGTHDIYFENVESYIGEYLEVPDGAKIKFTGIFRGFKLPQDIVIDGDTTYDCEDMYLNGHTLTVDGDLIQRGGRMCIDNGTLNVNGNYTITNKTHVDSETGRTVEDSNGILKMENTSDTINVHGDFCTKSNQTCYDGYAYNCFTKGTLAIDGNFYQYNNGTATNFVSSGTIVKFVGKGTHKITSESPETNIPDIVLTNGATLSFNGNFGGFSPVSSCTFSSSAPIIAKVTGNTVQAVGSGTAKITIEDTSNKSTVVNLTVNEFIMGDANGDGEFTIADVVLLQKWLLAVPHVRLANWEACDLCKDGRIDVFDLCLLKRKLINS